ncbi:MAG: GNAT family N-acetyltransferase [Saprospiraceae bacterium]|nr:GNAT family N-acetyltransferase [Saprospiraceae bacterium]
MVRRPEPSDFEWFFRAMSDPGVMRYIRTPISDEQAVRDRVQSWENYTRDYPKLGVFVAVSKSDGAFVGYCVARHVNFDSFIPEFEIGYTFLKPYWGQGLASELVPVLAAFAFEQTQAPYLVAFTDPENLASQRVLTKNGFELFGQRQVYEGISNEYRLLPSSMPLLP